jgi:hypothetical protein
MFRVKRRNPKVKIVFIKSRLCLIRHVFVLVSPSRYLGIK